MNFKFWILNEISLSDISVEKLDGSKLHADPALELAMYIAYRMTYDEITNGNSWSHQEWTYPASGGTRAPHWIFYGTFPTQKDKDKLTEILEKNNYNIQKAADYLLKNPIINLKYVSGICYRIRNGKSIKMTGTYGSNFPSAKIAKMIAFSKLIEEAEDNNLEIFIGVDENIRNLIGSIKTMMPKLKEKGLVTKPELDLHEPPKDVAELIYNIVSNNPDYLGSGTWGGFNKETGGLKFDLSGTGFVEKFVFGNSALWKSQLIKALNNPELLNNSIARTFLDTFKKTKIKPPQMIVNLINKAIKKYIPNASDISADGIKWVLERLI